MALPWSAVELVLGLGGRSFTRGARARLEELRGEVNLVSDETGLPAALLAGLAFVESEVRPEARGPELSSGERARGLLQVLPSNFRRLGVPSDRWHDPTTNLRAGARILLEPPAHFGEVEPGETLAAYGGFVEADPTSYIRDVQTMALRAASELDFSLLPRPPFNLPDLA